MLLPTQADAVFFSALLPRRPPQFWQRLKAVLNEQKVPHGFIAGTWDIWACDYCPIQVSPTQFVQFTYAPDYLADAPSLRTGPENWLVPRRRSDALR